MFELTASTLFAGEKHISGPNSCFFCGAYCDSTFKKKDLVAKTFTNHAEVLCPNSNYVCTGCAMSVGQGPDEMVFIDGSIKKRENRRGMQPRMYSWILTDKQNFAATKAHKKEIRELLIDPPKPPYSLVLSESGQKHLIFRSPVVVSEGWTTLQIEEEIVIFKNETIPGLIVLADKVSAALGARFMAEGPSMRRYIAFAKYYDDMEILERWEKLHNTSMERLLLWLVKSQKEAKDEYPSPKSKRVSREACRGNKKNQRDESERGGSSEGRGGAVQLQLGDTVQ